MAKAQNNERKYDLVQNWGLYCYEVKEIKGGVVLKCSKNKKKSPDSNEYTAPLFVDVMCMFDNCEIAEDEYEKNRINVDGQLSIGEYTNKDGVTNPTITIFATKVTKFQSQK